jgi:hypothetical protein
MVAKMRSVDASFDAYVKFIEGDFLGGQRLAPAADGRPDPRPTVHEDVPLLGTSARISISINTRAVLTSCRRIPRAHSVYVDPTFAEKETSPWRHGRRGD